MSLFDFFIVFALLALGLGGLWAWLFMRLRDRDREISRLNQRIEQIQTAFDAMIGAASGSDKRLAILEKRLQELGHRQDIMEENQNVARPYDEAIRMVRQGASARRLVEELGLTRNEADLLIMLHGGGPGPAH